MAKVTVFAAHKAQLQGKMQGKVATLEVVRESLQEAKSLLEQGRDMEGKAEEIIQKPSLLMYQAQVAGQLTKEEVTEELGKAFGFKVTSKTPDGKGEQIRKRIVRAVASYEYAKGGDAPSYLEGVDRDEVMSIINAIDSGDITVNTAYGRLGELKDKPERVSVAFNVGSLTKLVAAITEEGAFQKIASSPALVAVYAALHEALTDLSNYEVPAEDEAAKVEPIRRRA
jgi:hypothetical protein